MILPLLLHHANRSISTIVVGRDEFYKIKNLLLKSGRHIDYEVQHIPGKECWSCDGTGLHTRYSNYPPYKPYEWNQCWHCHGGWYKLPMWICLSKIKFGGYYFHKPLKKELQVVNPFTQEELGWVVTDRPIIEGYIEHQETNFGWIALLILFYLYDKSAYIKWRSEILDQLRWRYIWRLRRLKSYFNWKTYIIKPRFYLHHLDLNNEIIDDLPF